MSAEGFITEVESSGVSRAKDLQRDWFTDSSLVNALNEAFNAIGFTQEYVSSCVQDARGASRKPKAIKDALWGMIEFDASAMRLIDCPIVQRLRRIYQLGFSYLTYPSAEHSRFIHSIGMAHIVSRFADAINRDRQREELKKGISRVKLSDTKEISRNDLIHAALLHDTGHLPFSHAAEGALEANPDDFTFGGLSYTEFNAKPGYYFRGLHLSETLSLLIVLSPRFAQFYREYVCVGTDSDEDAIYRIACLIGGVPPAAEILNIHHIISSSAVDADKVDYVSRDAVACGIPVGVDVSRVYLGSGLLRLDAQNAQQVFGASQESTVFALNASGWDTFDEIIRSRGTLYQRVYLHGVTRTAEALLTRALHVQAISQGCDPRLTDAIALWAQNDTSTINLLVDNPHDEVRAIGWELKNRRLPKKACVLASGVIAMQAPFDEILPRLVGQNVAAAARNLKAGAFERRLTRQKSTVFRAVDLENEIIDEANRLRNLVAGKLHESFEWRFPATENLKTLVLIPIATLDKPSIDAPVFQHGEVLRADEFTNARGVIDAADFFRAVGYVMAPEEWRELVLVATRVVLYRRSLTYPPDLLTLNPSDGEPPADVAKLPEQQEPDERSWDPVPPGQVRVLPTTILDAAAVARRVGANTKQLQELISTATREGYFDAEPLLAKREDPKHYEAHAKVFDKFDGEGGWRVTARSVAAFLDQVPPNLRAPLAKALKAARYLGQTEVTSLLAKTLSSLADGAYRKQLVVPLSPSSGGLTASFIQPLLAGGTASYCTDLETALRASSAEDLIVFVDDNSVSGVQATAQLYAYAGVERSNRPVELRNETGIYERPLPPELVASFKQSTFVIAVAAGADSANRRVTTAAKKLGLSTLGVRYGADVTADHDWNPELRDWLESVGKELIAWRHHQKAYERLTARQKKFCDERAFGFGGLGGLRVLSVQR